ncbi:putative quinol monooxygenase [Nocardia sp. alder85J]|uniref:putative quinol monooxygenase n=1 Tax=Nocardia sp. alder85J TaxID=2862949 RepID=UPI001CD4E299|nr:antibiotic biosynthesis monooxygenase [Nocardia sp. alder85J]MCX4097636.1 antibiotic biosynthesis monooxygenase [Nocardia sp. alder85J]
MTANFFNVIEVDPAKQQELIELLEEGTESVIRHRPGFVSVNLFASADGSKVINWAQWAGPEDAEATLGDPAAQEFAKRTAAIAEASPGVYALVAEFKAEPA